MRIAYILGLFPALTETFIGEEIRAMEAMGHTIILIALHRPDSVFQPQDEALAARTIYFCEIDPEQSRALLRQYAFRLHRAISFTRMQTSEPHVSLLVHAAHLANRIRQERCTHVHAHFAWGAATYAIAAAKLLRLPITFTCHGSDVFTHPIDLPIKCKAASAVIGVSPSILSAVQTIAPHVKCHLIPCGVDIEHFKPVQDMSSKQDRWLFIGRLMECKGIDDILTAWAQ